MSFLARVATSCTLSWEESIYVFEIIIRRKVRTLPVGFPVVFFFINFFIKFNCALEKNRISSGFCCWKFKQIAKTVFWKEKSVEPLSMCSHLGQQHRPILVSNYQPWQHAQLCRAENNFLSQTSTFWILFIQFYSAGSHTEHSWRCSEHLTLHLFSKLLHSSKKWSAMETRSEGITLLHLKLKY
jgi:hypothetical protein